MLWRQSKAGGPVQMVFGVVLRRRYEQPLPFNRSRLVEWRVQVRKRWRR